MFTRLFPLFPLFPGKLHKNRKTASPRHPGAAWAEWREEFIRWARGRWAYRDGWTIPPASDLDTRRSAASNPAPSDWKHRPTTSSPALHADGLRLIHVSIASATRSRVPETDRPPNRAPRRARRIPCMVWVAMGRGEVRLAPFRTIRLSRLIRNSGR